MDSALDGDLENAGSDSPKKPPTKKQSTMKGKKTGPGGKGDESAKKIDNVIP